ncbi:amino acid permease, partial [archaeon]
MHPTPPIHRCLLASCRAQQLAVHPLHVCRVTVARMSSSSEPLLGDGSGADGGRVPPITIGWGSRTSVTVFKTRDGSLVSQQDVASGKAALDGSHAASKARPHPALDQFRATSIAGNDLLSSCLYTAGSCALTGGKLAPFGLALVAFMLYFFRYVYSEVVTAMPVNGGSYNALLNTTSKRFAALAACLSLISYVATAVVSGSDCVIYLKSVWTGLNVQAATVVVLAAFAALTLLGVGESSVVATGMFFLHVITLAIIVVWSIVYGFKTHWDTLGANWNTEYPNIVDGNSGSIIASGTWFTALFFGYSSALLGITGFETAANYVEEMKDSRTYVNTLRNMWWVAAAFNPIISVCAMTVLDMSAIYANSTTVLSAMAYQLGGKGLQTFVAIDATIVLAGSVLTAYVGVCGLMRRMALDRCLPELFMTVNKARGTPHWVIITFFALTSSLFLLLYSPTSSTGITQLENVYALSFLSVMCAFAISAMILKWKRPDLPRMVISSWGYVITAFVFVFAGLLGNIISGPETLPYFVLYFGITIVCVFLMFARTRLLRVIYVILRMLLADKKEAAAQKRKRDALREAHARNEDARRSGDHGAHVVGLTSPEAMLSVNAPPSAGSADKMSGAQQEAVGGMRASVRQALERSDSTMAGWALVTAQAAASGRADPTQPEEGSDEQFLASLLRDGRVTLRYRLFRTLLTTIYSINSKPMVYFAKEGDLPTLNKAVQYVRDNEQTAHLIIIHVVDDTSAVEELSRRLSMEGGADGQDALGSGDAFVAAGAQADRAMAITAPSSNLEGTHRVLELVKDLPPLPATARLVRDNSAILDAVYPKMQIDSLIVRGTRFGPPAVSFLAEYLGVTPNLMFMAMPDVAFPHQFSALGGVRVITRSGKAGERRATAQHLSSVLSDIALDHTRAVTAAHTDVGQTASGMRHRHVAGGTNAE